MIWARGSSLGRGGGMALGGAANSSQGSCR